ncbi:hypothetical protein Cst_c04180 [Thermoclostridium stercorarium subsp. stercorarium DSM 8532]|uniref:Uncharacterized protein n=1 Tax=Thermoclostridium stercorarium (strain ATCC 35414 / DSM 8532 / NCIMB 11754) TaxID=1121335 RepID=L7VHD1_THES1|nr:hypothetical protein [Thermoclostridium stercorarium]AGC67440.1 hypothetical protein Cst_c04180 [Thermoclostridium stercorarium subsp. stercorarium DSM 8532]AGI38500.1 hypothetical protein Clst_0399 [Thermoclostridium stercorarium subsp. stercorarium DSM 8532]UZQ86034.1 hypothetical protein ODU73_000428 [Thermoclostridium stercorarium]
MVNSVIAGDYKGLGIGCAAGKAFITTSILKPLYLDKSTVESYEIITEEHRKSVSSGVARGLIGGALLGPVGMLAGGLSAKNKGTYQIAIQFKDGKKSLIEVNDKVYKAIIATLF